MFGSEKEGGAEGEVSEGGRQGQGGPPALSPGSPTGPELTREATSPMLHVHRRCSSFLNEMPPRLLSKLGWTFHVMRQNNEAGLKQFWDSKSFKEMLEALKDCASLETPNPLQVRIFNPCDTLSHESPTEGLTLSVLCCQFSRGRRAFPMVFTQAHSVCLGKDNLSRIFFQQSFPLTSQATHHNKNVNAKMWVQMMPCCQTWGVFQTPAILPESSGKWGAVGQGQQSCSSHTRWAAVLCRLVKAHESAPSSAPPAELSDRSKIWGCTRWTVFNYLRKKCWTTSDLTPNLLSGGQREHLDTTEAPITVLVECVSQPGIAPLEHLEYWWQHNSATIFKSAALLQSQSKTLLCSMPFLLV